METIKSERDLRKGFLMTNGILFLYCMTMRRVGICRDMDSLINSWFSVMQGPI